MTDPETTVPAAAPAMSISLNFLYQLIGQKEVELAVMRERVLELQAEVGEVKALITANVAAGEPVVSNATPVGAKCAETAQP